MIIKVNKPPFESYDYSINIDLRWTIEILKNNILKEIGLIGIDIRIFKGKNNKLLWYLINHSIDPHFTCCLLFQYFMV